MVFWAWSVSAPAPISLPRYYRNSSWSRKSIRETRQSPGRREVATDRTPPRNRREKQEVQLEWSENMLCRIMWSTCDFKRHTFLRCIFEKYQYSFIVTSYSLRIKRSKLVLLWVTACGHWRTKVCLTRVWQPLFPLFLWQDVRDCHLNLANHLGAVLRVYINIIFISTPQNVDFAH